jgi:hypothetical protein
MELFGFQIKRTDKESEETSLQRFVPDIKDDGATEVATGGYYGQYIDLQGTAKDEADLVTKYRDLSLQPECDTAIEDIINESIVMNRNSYAVDLNLDESDIPVRLKKLLKEEFKILLSQLDFGNKGYETFRRWYVDGRLYYQIVIDAKNPREGIKELRYIDPRKIRKIREQKKNRDLKTGITTYKDYEEHYIYNSKGLMKNNSGIRISADSICHITSGLVDSKNKMSLGHLHKALKPMNQLRMLEDASIIYRLARAPERRIFYIDVGNLPKAKAEQYLRDMMVKHKNKLVYDASTGEIRDDRRHMTMLEDFWLPRREGGRGTEITTLPGGQNLGEMEDVLYFQKKLYKALNVPISRLDSEAGFSLGRASEISRDEVKFSRFISRLRSKFSLLFDNLLETQVVLKGIMNKTEWAMVRDSISYTFENDNHFEELKNAEIMTERLRLLNDVDQLVGTYFSKEWVRKNVLRMSETEIENMQKEIDQESEDGENDDVDDTNGDNQSTENIESPKEELDENFKPNETLSQEESELVKSMTRFYDSLASDQDEDETY